MIQKIKNIAMAALLPLVFMAPLALAPAASAACSTDISNNISKGINAATGNETSNCDTAPNGGNDVKNLAAKIVNLLSVLVGIIAVIMIIIGGFRYITSGGSNDKVAGAKNTLIYAIVGLIIVALAQFIVHFVLANVTPN